MAKKTGKPQVSPEIRQCCEYICDHLEQKLTLEELAQAAGYSKYYLTQKFSKETGMSIRAFVTAKRVMRAKYLLLHTGMPVEAISQRLNFSSRSHFAAAFRASEGVSPTEFRALAKAAPARKRNRNTADP